MEIAGYAASLGIGLLLGMIGGGGSILTMPVLVYLFGISPLLATSYSLFIVGAVSLFGAIGHYRKGLVNIQVGMLFGISSVITVILTKHFLVPLLPEVLITVGDTDIHTGVVLMIFFGLLMLAASATMISNRRRPEQATPARTGASLMLAGYGAVVGVITGLLGAGGGFLLIPALILFAGVPIKNAVGTSLMIISLNSLAGVISDPAIHFLNWWLLIKIMLMAMAGLFTGIYLSRLIPAERLKNGFGLFVLILGIYVIAAELIKLQR